MPDTHRIYYVKLAMTFLRAGVPLNKIESFCPILKEYAFSLGGRGTISDLIPFILQNKQTVVKQEIEGRDVTVVFGRGHGSGVAFRGWLVEHSAAASSVNAIGYELERRRGST